MDIYSFLATIILITSIVSLVMAFAAYIAYKIREIRKPIKSKRIQVNNNHEPIFLKPVDTESILKEWQKDPNNKYKQETSASLEEKKTYQ